eukprot:ANDGO_00284.mRNA.1 Kinesin heavy chain
MSEEKKSRLRVYVRLRPPLPEETKDAGFEIAVQCFPDRNEVVVDRTVDKKAFAFDGVLQPNISQIQVFNSVAKDLVDGALDGYNGTCFAYGQSGTGKTHTLSNMDSLDESEYGLIPRSIQYLFEQIDHFRAKNASYEYKVTLSYIQIYLEMIQDLLNTESTNLQIREDADTGVFIKGVREVIVTSLEDCVALIREGDEARVVALTKLNASSSRSHACLVIKIERRTRLTRENQENEVLGDGTVQYGKLTLVDLAGSERMKKTGASGKQAEEAKAINLSLSALGNVISALTDPKQTHVPFRDSKLTRLLQDSLGGNGKTSVVVTLRPDKAQMQESMSTILFGQRAMKVVTSVRKNQDVDYRALSIKLQAQVDLLNDELQRMKLEGAQQEETLASMNEAEIEAILAEHEREMRAYAEKLQLAEEQAVQDEQERTSRIADLVSQNSSLKDEVQICKRRIDGLLKDLKTLEDRQRESAVELEETTTAFQSQIQKLEQSVTSLDAEKHSLTMDLHDKNSAIRVLRADIEEARKENDAYLKEIEFNEKSLLTASAQVSSLEARFADARLEIEKTEAAKKSLESQVQNMNGDLSVTKGSLEKTKEEKRELHKQLLQLKSEIRDSEAVSQTRCDKINLLEQDLERSRSERKKLEVELHSVRQIMIMTPVSPNKPRVAPDGPSSPSKADEKDEDKPDVEGGGEGGGGGGGVAFGSNSIVQQMHSLVDSLSASRAAQSELQHTIDKLNQEIVQLKSHNRDLGLELEKQKAASESLVEFVGRMGDDVCALPVTELCNVLGDLNDPKTCTSVQWRQRIASLYPMRALSVRDSSWSLLCSLEKNTLSALEREPFREQSGNIRRTSSFGGGHKRLSSGLSELSGWSFQDADLSCPWPLRNTGRVSAADESVGCYVVDEILRNVDLRIDVLGSNHAHSKLFDYHIVESDVSEKGSHAMLQLSRSNPFVSLDAAFQTADTAAQAATAFAASDSFSGLEGEERVSRAVFGVSSVVQVLTRELATAVSRIIEYEQVFAALVPKVLYDHVRISEMEFVSRLRAVALLELSEWSRSLNFELHTVGRALRFRTQESKERSQQLQIALETGQSQQKMMQQEKETLVSEKMKLQESIEVSSAQTGRYLLKKSFVELELLFKLMSDFFLQEKSASWERFEKSVVDAAPSGKKGQAAHSGAKSESSSHHNQQQQQQQQPQQSALECSQQRLTSTSSRASQVSSGSQVQSHLKDQSLSHDLGRASFASSTNDDPAAPRLAPEADFWDEEEESEETSNPLASMG